MKRRQPGRREVEVQMRPIREVRIDDAMEDPRRASHGDVFVRPVERRQPEVDTPKSQAKADHEQSGDRCPTEPRPASRANCRRGLAGLARTGRPEPGWARASWPRAS